jgi:hypothetical protein
MTVPKNRRPFSCDLKPEIISPEFKPKTTELRSLVKSRHLQSGLTQIE